MADLNVMLREQAVNGLQAVLDAAVTAGDTVAARKAADDLAKLAVSTAPKAAPYGNAEIKAELNKLDWFGVDPKKSGRVIALGKDMDPKKFATAELFAAALVKAVEDEFKPTKVETDLEDEDVDAEGDDSTDGKSAVEKKPRKTDGPGEGDANQRSPAARRTSGAWTKLTDAPADIQKDIKRQADKFVAANAPKEQREKFIASALGSHYAAHVRKGKK